MKKVTAILIAMGMMVSVAGQSYAAIFSGTENTEFAVSAVVGDRPASYDYAVKMFFEGDDPVMDGVDMAKSKNLNFQALKWEHGRWNGTFAWCLQFFMDAPVPYQLSVQSTTGIVGKNKGINISESVIVTPHWAYDYAKSEPADKFIWDDNYDPSTPCIEANGCKIQDAADADETIMGYNSGDTADASKATIRNSAKPISELAGVTPIYSSGATARARVMRAYVGIFNIEDGLTEGEINALPGKALKDAPADTYEGTITFTMTAK